ncbi:MAG: 50S ribosomal protein L22 [Planctomycetota bacterium]
MKLRYQELSKRASEAGLTVDDLARAIERDGGLQGEEAVKAVKNWLAGRDHPRCRKVDIEALSAAVNAPVSAIAAFVSKVRHHRGSPLKAKLVIDLIRGRTSDDAKTQLEFSLKRASTNVQKALQAAEAEAEANGADVARLVVAEATIDEGPHIKRFRPKDRGRAHPILKRTSHITVALHETA